MTDAELLIEEFLPFLSQYESQHKTDNESNTETQSPAVLISHKQVDLCAAQDVVPVQVDQCCEQLQAHAVEEALLARTEGVPGESDTGENRPPPQSPVLKGDKESSQFNEEHDDDRDIQSNEVDCDRESRTIQTHPENSAIMNGTIPGEEGENRECEADESENLKPHSLEENGISCAAGALSSCETDIPSKCVSYTEEQSKSGLDVVSELQANVRTGLESNPNPLCNSTEHSSISQRTHEETHSPHNTKSSSPVSSETQEQNGQISVTTIPHEACSQLGTDLLLMYLNQVDCDCCIVVDGEKFPAHKCILSARSEYFEAMLGGQWAESLSQSITLEGVTSQAVNHLMLFLYGGVLALPSDDTSADLLDLFLVADMYGVSSLNKVLCFYLRRDLCHFFHKPCPACTLTAADALSLCHNFNLEDLEQRCLKWIGKNFPRIWPSKTFAGLPESLQQLSLRSIMGQFTAGNVLDIIVECNRLTSSLPRVKWTETVLCLLTQLMDAAIEFTSSNFVQVIRTPEFLLWAQGGATWKASALQGIFTSAIDSLPIDAACHVFQALLQLQATLVQTSEEEEESSKDLHVSEEVTGLLETMVHRCERFLRMHINKVMRSSQWPELPKPVQTRIMETSAYLSLADLPEPKPRPVAKRPVSARQTAPPRPAPVPEVRRLRARGSTHGMPSTRAIPARAGVSRGAASTSSRSSAATAAPPSGQQLGRTGDRGQRDTRPSQGQSTARGSDRSDSHSGNSGSRARPNPGRRTPAHAQREVSSRAATNARNNQGTSQTKTKDKVEGHKKSNEEPQPQEGTEVSTIKTNEQPERQCEDLPGCSNPPQSLENGISAESGLPQPTPEANETEKTDAVLPSSISECEGDISDEVLGTPAQASNAVPDIGLAPAVSEISSSNGTESSAFSQHGINSSPEQYSLTDDSESPAMGRASLGAAFAERGTAVSPAIHINARDQRSLRQEASPNLRGSRLPIATRSPRQRWSVGSGDGFGGQHHHHHYHQEGDVGLEANHSSLQILRSFSLPPGAAGQEETSVGAEGGVVVAGNSAKGKTPPVEIKIVKMSRPLSVGFVIPPN